MEPVVEKAMNAIRNLKGVMNVYELSDEDRTALMELEFSRKGDIIPVVNKGLKECMKRQYVFVLFKNCDFRSVSNSTILLVTDKGRILGREVLSPAEREKYQCRNDTYFLSSDFVLFKNDKAAVGAPGEKQFFILPPIPFPELDPIENIEDVVSCSPSTEGDYFLKNKYSYPDDPKIATILVGFSVKVK